MGFKYLIIKSHVISHILSSSKGNIWTNLVLVFPRFTQSNDDQKTRLLENESSKTNQNSKINQLKRSVEDAKEFLIHLANEHSWNITSVDEKGIQDKTQKFKLFQYCGPIRNMSNIIFLGTRGLNFWC